MNLTHEEKMLEAYYTYISEAHIDNVLEALDGAQSDIDSLEVPLTLDQWVKDYVKKLKQKERKAGRVKSFKSIGSRASVVLLLLVISTTVLSLSVEAIRVRLFNMLLDANEIYTEISFDSQDNETIQKNTGAIGDLFIQDKVTGNYYPAYITEGYELEEVYHIGDMMRVVFINNLEQKIMFGQTPLDGNMQIDTEDAVVTHPIIKGETAILAEEEGRIILVWHNNEYAFSLIGEMSVEEAIIIAESVVKE